MSPPLSVYPASLPRVRVEWLIAGTRVAIATSALFAFTVDTTPYLGRGVVMLTLLAYLLYGLAVLALVWSPVQFGRGWDLALHLFDMLVFVLTAGMSDLVASPFFASFSFLIVSATLRWQAPGTVSTAVVALGAYTGVFMYGGPPVFGLTAYRTDVFVVRIAYLATIASLLGFFGALQRRSFVEINRLASWPRRITRDPRDVVGEVVAQSTELIRAPRVLIVWEEPTEGRVNVAWNGDEGLMWSDESEGMFGAVVVPSLDRVSFQAADATSDATSVVTLGDNGFRYRTGRPLNEALRARFNIKAVQSWPLNGELIQGRLFALDKRRMRLDDLVIGELVARLAVSRLDNLYLLDRLRETAALEARVRVARDLHDSLLQAQTGAALQLLVARRMLDSDPVGGRVRLEDVQKLLERCELDMRSFIRRLRPEEGPKAPTAYSHLSERLEGLRKRVSRQWDVKVALRVQGADQLSGPIVEDVYRLAQEGAINAARHADPSIIKIDLTVEGDKLRIGITDDGQGFPFHGTFDLATLSQLNKGPQTLRERVAALHGDLILRSNDAGTQLLITLPLAGQFAEPEM